MENPRERSMLRRVCSAWIFIRPIAVPSPNNVRPSFVRTVPSAREIQPRPQLRISPGLTHTHRCLHTRSEYYVFYIAQVRPRAIFYLGAVQGGSIFTRTRIALARFCSRNCKVFLSSENCEDINSHAKSYKNKRDFCRASPS